MWSWYTGAGLTVVERIDRMDHKLQQTVPKLGVALPCRVRRRAATALVATLSGSWAATTAAATTAAATASSTATAATPAAASGLPGRRYAAASARTRHATHARLATVGRVRMLLEHTQRHYGVQLEALTIVIVCSRVSYDSNGGGSEVSDDDDSLGTGTEELVVLLRRTPVQEFVSLICTNLFKRKKRD